MNPKTETSGLAICALVCALLGIFPVAIITGHMAKTRIRNDDLLTGEGLAVTGLILGYLELGLFVLLILSIVVLIALGSQVNHTFTTQGTSH